MGKVAARLLETVALAPPAQTDRPTLPEALALAGQAAVRVGPAALLKVTERPGVTEAPAAAVAPTPAAAEAPTPAAAEAPKRAEAPVQMGRALEPAIPAMVERWEMPAKALVVVISAEDQWEGAKGIITAEVATGTGTAGVIDK